MVGKTRDDGAHLVSVSRRSVELGELGGEKGCGRGGEKNRVSWGEGGSGERPRRRAGADGPIQGRGELLTMISAGEGRVE